MKQISNKEYEEYQKYLRDRINGRILTPNGLRFICATNNYDPEKIGRHMLRLSPSCKIVRSKKIGIRRRSASCEYTD
ncbi:MAG: hypothetical protein ACI4ET_07455 [Bilifractor sp.]